MYFEYVFEALKSPAIILFVAVGVFAGVYVGAVPGLSGTMAISLLASFTFGWETDKAVALMVGVFVGVVFGGSRSAILLNIPGAPAAVATGFDGYPLSRKGLAGLAMGAATTQSAIGTIIGTLALAFFAPAVAKIALRFQSVDYLLLAIMGLMMVGSLGGGSFAKSVISAGLGVFLGTVGMDPISAVRRFTFGDTYLNSGVNFIVALIGLFGASEALYQIALPGVGQVRQKIDKIMPSLKQTLRFLPLTLRSAVIGVIIGALPGAGGDIAALLAYDQARAWTKKPTAPFGQGAIEGVIAPETANNAAIGGAFIPMLTLGIPGDAVTAVLMGVFLTHGLRPGPNLINESPDIFALIVACLMLASVFLPVFGLTGVRLFAKIAQIPKALLMPVVLVLSVIGAYAVNNNLYDVFWMFGFGVAGYFMKRYDYPIGPMVLGIILCNLLETNLIRGIRLSGSVWELCLRMLKSPVSITLLILMALMAVARGKRNADKDASRRGR